MAFRDTLTLPSVTVNASGREAGPISVPLGCTEIRAQIDGSFWPSDSRVEVWLDIAEDGATRKPFSKGTTSLDALVGGKCSIGWSSVEPNQNANLKLWAGIVVTSGSPIVLNGRVQVTP
jgi:hypothetical protein